jgi:OOP family OmpA-OmpF porin
MPRFIVSSGLFLLLTLVSMQCFGDIKPGTFYLSPYLGGYTFDGTQHLETRPVYGLRFGYNYNRNLGVEALFDYVWTNMTRGAAPNGEHSTKSYGYGVDALYHFMPDSKLVPFVAAGIRGNTVDRPEGLEDKTSAAFDYGGGIEYALTDAVSARADIRHLILTDNARSNLEYTIGLSWFFGGAAPAVPVPPPPAPEAALSATPATVTAGQEAELSWTSRNATNCEVRPGVGPVAPQGKMSIKPEADTSYTLICNGPGGAASSQAAVKVVAPAPPPPPAPAPVVMPAPAPVPKPEPAPIPKEMLCYTINIEFATGKADIQPRYHGEMVKLADFMKAYPGVKGVIEGHTDNRGGKDYNIRLSERRAASVVAYLIKLGIDKSRLSTKGYGFAKPIADNKTAEGRQKNRRIVANFDCVEKH